MVVEIGNPIIDGVIVRHSVSAQRNAMGLWVPAIGSSGALEIPIASGTTDFTGIVQLPDSVYRFWGGATAVVLLLSK